MICTPKVRQLLEVHIFMRKKGIKNKKYSAEFKIFVIMDMRANNLGYRETARKYNIAANDSQGKDRLKVWERIYLEEGADGLMTERRGRKSTGRPKKLLDKSVEEDLIAENQRLRMEIEYLKKLSALVLADERENGKRRK